MSLILGLIKLLIKASLYFLIFAAIIVLIPNLPPYTSFTSIKLEPTQPSVGPLAPNGLLNNAEHHYKGKLIGPEAFQVHKGELYASLATGEIVKLLPGDQIKFVTQIGQPCGHLQDHVCGRPLGFQIDGEKDVMYVADAYYGIWKVDLKNDKKQLLVSPRVVIGDRKPKLFNSIALVTNGDLYWTDSTSDFLLKDGAYNLVTDPSGRLFHYNAAKNESRVLMDNLWFANGVTVSPDNQFVVVAETHAFRLHKYYLNGPKKGKSEIFTAGLPGTPDNLRALPDGSGLLVGLHTMSDAEHPVLLKTMAETPIVRKFIARLMRLIEIPFEFLNQQYPHILFEEVVYFVGHYKSILGLAPHRGGLVQIDWDGNIVASYHNTDESMPAICDGIVFNDRVYLGAPHGLDFVGSVPAPPLLKKAFTPKSDSAKKEIPKQTKPVEQTPKQTQEKPKVAEKKEVPKVEEKKEQPKAKPQEAPKPTTPPKPVEIPKTTTPKPIEKKPEASSQSGHKVTTPPPQAASKPTQAKRPESKPAADAVKVDSKKPPSETPPKVDKSGSAKPAPPEQIPIKEDIPSDTVKPSKETLKVIKKGGPTEIPNPNL